MHIIIGLNVGGAELMLKRLIESHRNNPDYQHSVISITNTGVIGTQLQALGVDVHALHMKSLKEIFRVMVRLLCLIRLSRPAVVQTWMYHADLLGGIAAYLVGNRNIIWGIRTTEINFTGGRVTAIVRKLCAWISGVVPHTIVCAAEASRRAHAAIGYEASRMMVIPNGFDVTRLTATQEQRESLRQQYGLGTDVVVIGYLGRFHPDKDQENFVRAAALVARERSNVHFLMVGRDLDSNNTQLAEWLTSTRYANRFVLLGERVDVPICLAAMDIFCLSSRTEGFPNAVGEAMAMGVPCVVTDVGDAAMLVADTGVVVPKEDPIALAQGMRSLLALTSDMRRKLGQKAKERIHAQFTMEHVRIRFESLYQCITRKGQV